MIYVGIFLIIYYLINKKLIHFIKNKYKKLNFKLIY